MLDPIDAKGWLQYVRPDRVPLASAFRAADNRRKYRNGEVFVLCSASQSAETAGVLFV